MRETHPLRKLHEDDRREIHGKKLIPRRTRLLTKGTTWKMDYAGQGARWKRGNCTENKSSKGGRGETCITESERGGLYGKAQLHREGREVISSHTEQPTA